MKAVTLKEPWGYAHVHLGKRVENRTWRIPKDRYALHSGKSYDIEGEQYIRSLGHRIDFEKITPSVIFAVDAAGDMLEVLDAPAALVDIPADQRQWAFGPWAHIYETRTFRVLPKPVPCGGAQGLWELPAPVWTAVFEQMLEMAPVVLNRHIHGKPQGSVYVGRPSKWGNPFGWDPKAARVSNGMQVVPKEEVLPRFREWALDKAQRALRDDAKRELRGRDLVCSCWPRACHADTWLEIANAA
jgi:hypothetical protein